MSWQSTVISPLNFKIYSILWGSCLLTRNNCFMLARALLILACSLNPILVCLFPLINENKTSELNSKRLMHLCTWEWIVMAFSFVVAGHIIYETWHQALLALTDSNIITAISSVQSDESLNTEYFSNTWRRVVENILQCGGGLFTQSEYASRWYEPSLGIRWYLDAQMIPEYRLYFELLFLFQPLLSAVLLHKYVGNRDSATAVRFFFFFYLFESAISGNISLHNSF